MFLRQTASDAFVRQGQLRITSTGSSTLLRTEIQYDSGAATNQPTSGADAITGDMLTPKGLTAVWKCVMTNNHSGEDFVLLLLALRYLFVCVLAGMC